MYSYPGHQVCVSSGSQLRSFQNARLQKHVAHRLGASAFRLDTSPRKPTVGARPVLSEPEGELSTAASATKRKRVGVGVLYPKGMQLCCPDDYKRPVAGTHIFTSVHSDRNEAEIYGIRRLGIRNVNISFMNIPDA